MLSQVVHCEFNEFYQNTFSKEHICATAFVLFIKYAHFQRKIRAFSFKDKATYGNYISPRSALCVKDKILLMLIYGTTCDKGFLIPLTIGYRINTSFK